MERRRNRGSEEPRSSRRQQPRWRQSLLIWLLPTSPNATPPHYRTVGADAAALACFTEGRPTVTPRTTASSPGAVHGEATSSTSATATRSTLARKDSGITSAAVSSSTLRVTTREHCRPNSTLSSRGSAASHGYSAASASTIRGGARGSCSSL
uniref:Uncharacterized protein n=1 Tax=Oryza barthii TaxID=65489 RepID=A0A0D3HLY8_9ORYZ